MSEGFGIAMMLVIVGLAVGSCSYDIYRYESCLSAGGTPVGGVCLKDVKILKRGK